MEPITTAIAAVSAASSAISFIKARVNDVQSVSELSGQISTLFSAQKVLNEKRNEQAGVGDISFRGSIDAVLEAKRLNEEMQQISQLINMRWPKPANQPSTWQEILNHHNEALRQQKAARQAAMREKARKSQELEETLKAVALIAFVIVVALVLFVFMFAAIARSAMDEIVL
jgi:putative salt-induced outer membrane protein YdiY